MIQGEAIKEIEIVPINPFKFYAIDEPERPRIYAIETREGKNYVFHPGCICELKREAQIRLLSDRAYAHPYFWSPFLLINSWL